jgi:hypothetical protein
MATNNKRANALYDFTVAASIVTFAFPEGVAQPITVNLDELTDDMKHQLMVHGLKQKVIDAGALSRDNETGKSPSPQDRAAAMTEVANRLKQGVWRVVGEGGGNSGGLLFRALVELYPEKTPDALREWLDKQSDKQKAALRVNPKVAPIIERLRAAQGKAASVDTDALLSELGDAKPKGKK